MKERSSPKFPLRLLKWFCKPEYHHDIEGDLLELYERRVKNLGYRKANWLLYKDVVLLFRPGMIRGFKFQQTLNPFFMLKHHLKIAFRLALRYKGYSAINLFGLAVGISCFLIIMLYIQDELSLFSQSNQLVFLLIAGVIFFVGFFAGLYPAFYLSAFKVVSVLKNLRRPTKSGLGLRQVLVVFQFALATLLIVGIIIVQKQMSLMQSTNLGFDQDQVIVIKNLSGGDRNFVKRNALAQLPGVINVGSSGQEVGLMDESWMRFLHVKDSDNQQAIMWGAYIDHNYLDVLGIEIKEGRNFSPNLDTIIKGISRTLILNETAVQLLDVPEPIIGQHIIDEKGESYRLVGVVEDFHATSLHTEIKPFAFVFTPFSEYVTIKMAAGNIPETLARIEDTWAGFVPDLPLDFYFLNAAIDQQYRSEQNFRTIFSAITGLSLIIACLGLFGLAAFSTEQRTKEIGIRKVFGASVKNILILLSKEFVKLVAIANLVSWPIAYLIMNSWLENYAYRTEIDGFTFLLTGTLALTITILTVGWQTLQAAFANPVDSLYARGSDSGEWKPGDQKKPKLSLTSAGVSKLDLGKNSLFPRIQSNYELCPFWQFRHKSSPGF